MGKAVLAAALFFSLSFSLSRCARSVHCSPKTSLHAWLAGSGDGTAAMGSAPAFPRSIVDDGLRAELVPCEVRGGGGSGGRARGEAREHSTATYSGRASIPTSKGARWEMVQEKIYTNCPCPVAWSMMSVYAVEKSCLCVSVYPDFLSLDSYHRLPVSLDTAAV